MYLRRYRYRTPMISLRYNRSRYVCVRVRVRVRRDMVVKGNAHSRYIIFVLSLTIFIIKFIYT